MTYSLSNNCTKKLLQSDAYCSSYRRRRSHMDFFETQCISVFLCKNLLTSVYDHYDTIMANICILFTCSHNSTEISHNYSIIPFPHSWLFFYYRQDVVKRQTAGIKFTHRPKFGFFAQQGRLVAPIHVKLDRADEHVGPLGCANFHINRHRVVGMRPQNIKNFHFL